MTGTPAALRGLPQLEDLGDLGGARVLVRADFNVPLEDVGDGIRCIGLDRAAKRNAIGVEMTLALEEALLRTANVAERAMLTGRLGAP